MALLGVTIFLIVVALAAYTYAWPEYLETVKEYAAEAAAVRPPYTHVSKWERAPGEGVAPFAGSAALDVFGDGNHVLFVGGGRGQGDVLIRPKYGLASTEEIDSAYEPSQAAATAAGLSSARAVHAAAAFDFAAGVAYTGLPSRVAGMQDLLVGAENALVLFINESDPASGTVKFSPHTVYMAPPNVAITGVALGDCNQNGRMDVLVCTCDRGQFAGAFPLEWPGDGAPPNVLLSNTGPDYGASSTGVAPALVPVAAPGAGANFNSSAAAFVDVTGDGRPDLIVANAGGPVQIFLNGGGFQFAAARGVQAVSGLGFWTGLTVFHNARGNLCAFLPNAGASTPAWVAGAGAENFRARREHLVLEIKKTANGLAFADATPPAVAAAGCGWGGAACNLNLRPQTTDLLFHQNYAGWWPQWVFRLPAAHFSWQGAPGDNFRGLVREAAPMNAHFGQTPVIANFNTHDKQLPALALIHVNQRGPLLVSTAGFRIDLASLRNFGLNVIVRDHPALANTTAVISDAQGAVVRRQQTVIGGLGFGSSQSRVVVTEVNAAGATVAITRGGRRLASLTVPASVTYQSVRPVWVLANWDGAARRCSLAVVDFAAQ
jgi:hypothetical protein